MARTKAVLGSGARLSDFLCASLLARVVPPEAVHAVLDAQDHITHKQITYDGVGVPHQTVLPLPTMFRASPAGFVRADAGLAALLERSCRCHRGTQRALLGALSTDGVDTLRDEFAGLTRLVAGLGERDAGVVAEPHLAALAGDHHAQQPTAGVGLGDVQAQARHAVDEFQTWLDDSRQRQNTQFLRKPWHCHSP